MQQVFNIWMLLESGWRFLEAVKKPSVLLVVATRGQLSAGLREAHCSAFTKSVSLKHILLQ